MNHWIKLLVPHFRCGHPKTNQNSIVYGESSDGKRLTRCRYCKMVSAEIYRRKKGIKSRKKAG